MPETPVNKEALLARLGCGQANGKSVATLAFEIGATERAIRKLREELVEDGVPVCAHPTTGYFIAATHAEVQANYDWLRGRGLHELTLAARLRTAFARFTGTDGADEPIPEL